jgi:hypothetical protein
MAEPQRTDDVSCPAGAALSYWRGQVDARLHGIEQGLLTNTTYTAEVKAALETTLKRTHEDICLELRRLQDKLSDERMRTARLWGGLGVLFILLNVLVPVLLKLWK